MAMLASEVRPKGPSTGVAVLNELAGRLDVGCTKVEHEERFHGRGQAPVHKLAQTELVALHRLPGNILPARSAFTRPDAVAASCTPIQSSRPGSARRSRPAP